MIEKTKLDEVRGIVLRLFDYTTPDGTVAKGMTIRPDDPNCETFPENFLDSKHPDFKIGQRVVQVTYSYKRPATEEDVKEYEKMKMECPKEIEEIECITYDEASYDMSLQNN